MSIEKERIMIMHGPGCLVVLGGRCVGRTPMLDSRPCWTHAHVGFTPMLDSRPCWAQYTGVILASDYVTETRLCPIMANAKNNIMDES